MGGDVDQVEAQISKPGTIFIGTLSTSQRRRICTGIRKSECWIDASHLTPQPL